MVLFCRSTKIETFSGSLLIITRRRNESSHPKSILVDIHEVSSIYRTAYNIVLISVCHYLIALYLIFAGF